MGIEPTPSAWKAEVLPLNYTRRSTLSEQTGEDCDLVEGGGFEPPKAEPSDLQSDPFDRSGIPPNKLAILRQNLPAVKDQIGLKLRWAFVNKMLNIS